MLRPNKNILITFISVLISSGEAVASQENYHLRMHHPGPPGHPYTLGANKFKELVERRSNEAIRIEIFPNQQLASGAKAIESVQFGTIDIAIESTMSLSNFVPEMGVINLPFLFEDRDDAYEALDGRLGDELKTLADNRGFKVLSYWDNGFRNISNSERPINSPQDLSGMKIRVPESEVFISTFESLGAIPTPMAFGELFTALQLHTVDGQENPSGHLIEYRLFEVQKYFSITNHIYTAEPILVNSNIYDTLPAEYQRILVDSAIEAGEYQRELSRERDDEYLMQILDEGIEVNTPDLQAFRNAVEPTYDRYEQRYEKLFELLNIQ